MLRQLIACLVGSLSFEGIKCLCPAAKSSDSAEAANEQQSRDANSTKGNTPNYNNNDSVSSSIPTCANTLRLLNLSWCNNFTSQVLMEISRNLPQLTIIDYFGEAVA
jgi:hypothetical protein